MSIASPSHAGNFLNVLVSQGTCILLHSNAYYFYYFNPSPNPQIQTTIDYTPLHPTNPVLQLLTAKQVTWKAYFGKAILPLFL